MSASPRLFLYRFGAAEFNERTLELRVDGVLVDVQRTPMRLLQALLQARGVVVTSDALLEKVWRRSPDLISRNVVANAVTKLRRALGDSGQHWIRAVTGEGYALSGSVECEELPDARTAAVLLRAGQPVPRRPEWRLLDSLGRQGATHPVWLAEHRVSGQLRVFKFGEDGPHCSLLRREMAIAAVLQVALGQRPEFVPIVDHQLDQVPGLIATDYAGADLPEWTRRQGGLATLEFDVRLQLFVDVAEAVDLAHSAGVLHQDLKPANILIETVAGRNQVRIIDFGSSRLLEPDAPERLQLSRLNREDPQPSGTLVYMAPELLSGYPATLASDVYALGVLLYQLVVADLERPIAVGWEADVEDPLLRGDIAAAVHGDPAQRLSSARPLAARLKALALRRRQLAQRREQTRRAAEAEMAKRRAAIRRRWLVALLAVLGSGLAISLLFAYGAAGQRDEARRSLEQTEAITGFLDNGLLQQADPEFGGDPDVRLGDAIGAVAGRVDAAFAQTPLLAAEVHQTLAYAFLRSEEFDAAVTHYAQAHALYEAQLGPTADQSLRSLFQWAQAMVQQGKLDEARARIDAGFAAYDGLDGGQRRKLDPLTVLKMYESRGFLSVYRNDWPAATADLHQVLDVALSIPGYPSQKVQNIRRNYAIALARGGHWDEGIAIMQTVLAQARRELAPDDPRLLMGMQQLAEIYLLAGRYSDARPLMYQAYEVYLREAGPQSTLTYSALISVADVEMAAGDALPAAAKYRQALDYYQTIEDHYSRHNFILRVSLAEALNAQGSWADVDRLLRDYLPPPPEVAEASRSVLQLARLEWADALFHLQDRHAGQVLVEVDRSQLEDQTLIRVDWAALLTELQGRQALVDNDRPRALALLQDALVQYRAIRVPLPEPDRVADLALLLKRLQG